VFRRLHRAEVFVAFTVECGWTVILLGEDYSIDAT
jgi:hypothetical protein